MSGFGRNEVTELEHNHYDQKHKEEHCCVGQNTQWIVVPTENKVTEDQRKNYTQAKSFLLFIPCNLYHQKLLKQKIIPSSGKIFTCCTPLSTVSWFRVIWPSKV